ncbi:DnaJ domain-containing protein [Mucilaginibacter mali]|uniref:DnaJ domain-containing protein n=1 Tax=Mucilaginibacter mali TaxID=2740462 RepID=A0A7D4UEX3_9SPHI|nr:DnaJ domain-containing protein [Mucilaginibacter mali]QKJ29556.1 DnaJ domain-containing protein [Mucilaginibacter mali]
MKDFYYILGTERDCTPQELNSAYRKLARKLQPPGQEQDDFLDSHFREVTEAFEILSDPVRRRKYDMAYKKHYQRRLYYFKLKHLNIAVTLSLILLTGLFGMYVYRSMNGGKKKAVVKPVAAEVVKPKYRHKKHRLVTAKPIAKKAFIAHVDTIKPVAVKQVNTSAMVSMPVPGVAKPNVPVKPAPEIIPPPTIARQADKQPPVDDNTYTTYLKANMTGVVSLHEQASYRSAVLANIPGNAKVQVLEKGAGFYKVAFNNQTGYVPKWTIGEP